MRDRNKRVQFRLNEKEYKRLRKQVEKTGFGIEQYMRNLVKGVEIKARVPEDYFKTCRFISSIANNINQIAHNLNATDNIYHDQISYMEIMILKCWEHIKELR